MGTQHKRLLSGLWSLRAFSSVAMYVQAAVTRETQVPPPLTVWPMRELRHVVQGG